MLKEEMRSAALAKRDAVDADWRTRQSGRLASFVDDLGFDDVTLVSGFLPIRSEIDLQPLMLALHDNGVPLCLPVVLDRETIIFRRYAPGMDLVDTGFGTRGPGPDVETVDPDVMLVPLAGFDDRGNRLGYGAGHYDR
ncbi:MAG: 5-formyltetrahydrofolate cyclo-ligase, partial [Pseudomonadota bacterium]